MWDGFVFFYFLLSDILGSLIEPCWFTLAVIDDLFKVDVRFLNFKASF